MSETYNPRERSFIKMPEVKCCVTCGQPLTPDIKPITNHMNKYVNDLSGHSVVMNSNEPYLEVQGVKLRRSDVKVEAPATIPPVTPKPSTEATKK